MLCPFRGPSCFDFAVSIQKKKIMFLLGAKRIRLAGRLIFSFLCKKKTSNSKVLI